MFVNSFLRTFRYFFLGNYEESAGEASFRRVLAIFFEEFAGLLMMISVKDPGNF